MQLHSSASIEQRGKTSPSNNRKNCSTRTKWHYVPFVTAIVFRFNCVDFACRGLYDCFTIMGRLAGVLDVACARCSVGSCSSLGGIVADGDGHAIFGRIRLALLLRCL